MGRSELNVHGALDLDLDVAIVGCGPVGVTLAGLLARRGVRVAAFDQDVDIHPLPRAVHFDHEVMRVFQELGLGDVLSSTTLVNRGMDFLTADRQVLLSMRPSERTTSGWPASLFFHQPDLELTLRDAARAAGADLRLGCGVASVDDRGDHVDVHCADGTTVTAAYVVACDGARSQVRKALGIVMDDLQFEEPWLVVDLVLPETMTRPSDVALQVCDPARPHTLVPMPAPRFRFEFMLLPGETQADLRTNELLASWIDPAGVTVERAAVYTFHGLIATEWRRGRVLLAGDAAHQTPPFLGQGMCAGVRDAANLAWKLERVVCHGADDALLDTYQREREPHVRAIVGLAVDFGRIICTTDAMVAAERDAGMLAGRAAGGGTTDEMPLPALTPGPVVLDGGGVPTVQVVLDGARFDDVVGPRFAVVVRHAAAIDGDGVRWWTDRGAATLDAEAHPDLAIVLDRAGTDAVVIRPDRCLLWAGAEVPVPDAGLAALIGT